MIRRAIGTSAAALALCATATALHAQSILDAGLRAAPQYHAFDIQSPSNIKISEFALPLFVLVPITPSFSVDVGSAWVQAHVEQTGAATRTTSNISGLTDTQIRGNYTFGNDFLILTAGVNLPTGKSTVSVPQQLAASLIGSDFLALPISNMGTGFGATGGLAVARPVGDWSVGAGLSMRRSSQYDPFSASGTPALHYQPGNEYRARVGLDRAVGTGRFAAGFTYSKFGDDNLGGSIYNTGDRYLTTLGFDNTVGTGTLTISGWDLFRSSGTIATGSIIGHENIGNANVAYGIPAGTAIVEPNVEGRVWTQSNGLPASLLTTLGLRVQLNWAGLAVLPSAGFSFGRLGAQDINGASATATMTGFHGELAIRLR